MFFDRFRTASQLLTAAQAPAVTPMPQLGSPWADADALSRLTLSELFGYSGRPVTRKQAMSIAPIKRGRNLIAGQIGHYPLIVMRGSARLPKQPALTTQIEAGRPRAITLAWIADALLFFGRAFLTIASRDYTGRPTAFRFVPEWQAQTDGAGNLLAVDGHRLSARDWVRIDGPDEGLLATSETDINDALALKLATAKASANPVPSIELHQVGTEPMTDAEIAALVNAWAQARSGLNGGVAYTNAAIETKTHGQAAEQLLINARNQSKIDLASDMNLPAWAVDASVTGSSLTYSNVQSRTRELIDYTLTPIMDAIVGRLSMDDILPAGQWATFDTSTVLAGSFGERMTAYGTAIDKGIYTAAECRALESGVPLEQSTTNTGATE